MSHFTRIKTELRCWTSLEKVIREKSWGLVENRKTLRGFSAQRLGADARLVDLRCGLDLAFVPTEDGRYEAIADWDFVERRLGKSQAEFMAELTRRYSYHKVKAEVAAAGFELIEETNSSDQSVTLRVRRWS